MQTQAQCGNPVPGPKVEGETVDCLMRGIPSEVEARKVNVCATSPDKGPLLQMLEQPNPGLQDEKPPTIESVTEESLLVTGSAPVSPKVILVTDSAEEEFVRQLAQFFDAKSLLQLDWKSARRVRCSGFNAQGQRSLAENSEFCASKLPFKDGEFDVVFNLTSLNILDESSLDSWCVELRRITNCSLWMSVEASPGRDRAWWENRFLQAGFRKHPRSLCILPFEAMEKEGTTMTLLFQKIPQSAWERYPLEVVKAERDLHMDMLRESGIRSGAHLARYDLAAQNLLPGMVVLDVACGLGYGAAILAAVTGVGRVVGVDLSEAAVDYARECYATVMPQLEFHSGDATQLHFLADASVDAVVSFETLEHLPNPDRLLQEFSRVLKPGGLFIGSVPNLLIDEQGRNPVPYHFHIYDHSQFREQVAKYFESQSLYRQNAGGGWKRPQPCQLRLIEGQQPTAADLQDAEWWITVATKLGAGSGPARFQNVGLANRDPLCTESADPSALPTVIALNPATRIVVLDEEARYKELFGGVFDLLGVRPEPGGDLTPEQILASKPDAILLSREWSRPWRLIANAARRANVPVIYVMDGVIEWSYVWNNLSFVKPEGTVLQPLLASQLCVVGRHPARILAGLGLANRIHVVGLPRLDGFPRTRVITAGQRPKILVATAKTFGHNVEHKTLVRRALRDLKNWFAVNPFVVPVWRIAEEVAEEIGVRPERAGAIGDLLSEASGTISFTSTCLLESMLKGVPTAQLDYRAVPLYVQTAWEIRCAEHISGVIQELLYPPAEKLAFQEQCLEDELELGNGSERLAKVICQAINDSRNPPSQPTSVLAAEFGRLDFHQVHSQLSSFSATLQAPLQYELDALQNLYERQRHELREARHTALHSASAQAEIKRLNKLCCERGELILKLDQLCREGQQTLEDHLRAARGRPGADKNPLKQTPEPGSPEGRDLVDPTDELKTLKATLRVQPQDASSWVRLGVMLRGRNELAESEIALQEALRLEPRNEQALLETGRTYLQQDRGYEAGRCFDSVVEINPRSVQALLCMAQCEEGAGDPVAARLDYLRVLKLEPDHSLANERIAILEATAPAAHSFAPIERAIATYDLPADAPPEEMMPRGPIRPDPLQGQPLLENAEWQAMLGEARALVAAANWSQATRTFAQLLAGSVRLKDEDLTTVADDLARLLPHSLKGMDPSEANALLRALQLHPALVRQLLEATEKGESGNPTELALSLGVSYVAANRHGEALTALQRARSAGDIPSTLEPALTNWIETETIGVQARTSGGWASREPTPYPLMADGRPKLSPVWLETTSFCNQTCSFCPDQWRETKRQAMDFDLFKRLVDELKRDFQVEYLQLNAYGEPLLHPKFEQMLTYLRDGNAPAPFFFTTHGMTLNERNVAMLDRAHPHGICVSLQNDGEESYARSRDLRIGDYAKLAAQVQNLVERFVQNRRACHVRLYQLVRNGKEGFGVPGAVLEAFPPDWERFAASVRRWEAAFRPLANGRDVRAVQNSDLDIREAFETADHPAWWVKLDLLRWKDERGGEQSAFISPRPVGTYANQLPLHTPGWNVTRALRNPHGCCFTKNPGLAVFSNGNLGICCLSLDQNAAFGNIKDFATLKEALASEECFRMFGELANGIARSPDCQVCLGQIERTMETPSPGAAVPDLSQSLVSPSGRETKAVSS